MSTDASRFYYLRLMSRRTSTSGARSAFSKPKFVQWGEVKHFSTSLEENPELESQAMKIVRTVGQAFDVCQRINEPEKSSAEDEERLKTPSTSSKKVSIGELPGTSGEFTDKLDKPRERLSSESGMRQRKSSNEPGCLDITRQRKSSSRTPSPSPSFTSLKPPDIPPSPRPPDKLGTSGGEVNRSISLTETSVVNPHDSLNRQESGGSHFYSSTLTNIPSLTCGGVETAQNTIASPLSLDSFIQAHSPSLHHQTSSPGALHYAVSSKANGTNPPVNRAINLSISPNLVQPLTPSQTNPFYQSAAQQLLLKSSELLSPGRTAGGAMSATSVDDHLLPALCTYSSYDALNQPQPTTLGQSIEHHSVTLLRTQLEQAQQQAQVAIAQVYLLRDQLASETTARIESQIRTQQLTQSNKELIDQVQVLVARLQNLETRLSAQTTNQPAQAPSAQVLTIPKSPERSISLQEPPRVTVPRLSLNVEGAGAQLDIPSPAASTHSARSEPAWPAATRRSPDSHRPPPELLQKRLSSDQTVRVKGESKKKLQRRKTVMGGEEHLSPPRIADARHLEIAVLEREPSVPGKARKTSLRLSPVQSEKALRKISDSAMLTNRTSSIAREQFHERPKSLSVHPSSSPRMVVVPHNEFPHSDDEDESDEDDEEAEKDRRRRKSPILADRKSPILGDKRENAPSRTPSLTSPSGTAGKPQRIKNAPAAVEGHRTVSLPSPRPNGNRLKSSLKRSSAVVGPTIAPAGVGAHAILENHLGEKDSEEDDDENDNHHHQERGKDSSTSSTDDHVTSGTSEFLRRKASRRSLRGTSSTASPKQRIFVDDDRPTSRSDYKRINSLQEQRSPRTSKNLDPRR